MRFTLLNSIVPKLNFKENLDARRKIWYTHLYKPKQQRPSYSTSQICHQGTCYNLRDILYHPVQDYEEYDYNYE